MKNISEIKDLLQSHKTKLVEKYNLKNLAIFGSFARNEASDKSDIDILVEFNKPIGLDFITLAEELEEILGIKVDLVTPNAIKPKMFDYIKKDLQYV